MDNRQTIDTFSFQLGMINCFVEMVACGVKPLAISPPMTPDDHNRVKTYSDRIVEGFGVNSFLEKALLSTALQSDEFTRDKWVILYYKSEAVKTAYLGLKDKQTGLMQAGRYDAAAGKQLSIEFLTLLGYSRPVIDEKLSGNHPDPFMLTDDL
ncbi:MAG: hypothetical protein HKM93_05355 [Desulfobacteraceae bacterium]|nr:hypothetical protein [Desulfobacteraceae bacterium]